MDNFHSDHVRDVDSHGNLVSLLMYLENLIFLKINDFACLFGGMSCLWLIDIIIIVFCENFFW